MILITSIESDHEEVRDDDTNDTVLPALSEMRESVENASKPKAEKTAKAPKAKAEKKAPKKTKTDDLLAMLKRAKGASAAEISESLGWLPHTTRAAISTLAKKGKMPEGHTLASEKIEKRGRVYRLVKLDQ